MESARGVEMQPKNIVGAMQKELHLTSNTVVNLKGLEEDCNVTDSAILLKLVLELVLARELMPVRKSD